MSSLTFAVLHLHPPPLFSLVLPCFHLALIDEDEDGYISWADWFLFCRRVEEALSSSLHRSRDVESILATLFEDLSVVVIPGEELVVSTLLEQKLIDMCVSARINQLHPLTQLFSFVPPDLRSKPLDSSLLLLLFESMGIAVSEDEPSSIDG